MIYLKRTFKPLVPYSGEWLDYTFGRFIHIFVFLGAYCIGDQADSRAILDVVIKREVTTTLPGIEPWPLNS
jgi:hypothetical protein